MIKETILKADYQLVTIINEQRSKLLLYTKNNKRVRFEVLPFYFNSSWSSASKTANSVVLISNECSFRMALTQTKLPISNESPTAGTMYQYMGGKVSSPLTYFNGVKDTDNLITYCISRGINNTNYAAPYCRAYTFAYGGKTPYLMSSGQAVLINNNYSSLNACMIACGASELIPPGMDHSNRYYTSTYSISTPGGKDAFEAIYGNNKGTYSGYAAYMDNAYTVIPVTDY